MSEQHVSKNQSIDLDTSSKDEIDLVEILCKIIVIRKKIYSCWDRTDYWRYCSIEYPQTVYGKSDSFSRDGSSKGTNGLAGLAASFLGSGATTGDGSDALNASLSSDIVSSTPFLLELLDITVSSSNKSKDITFSIIFG